ncbi:MAG: fimbrillin family protein, partial [Rikenella sp.]|nr:fimbrillin family protein [Rikenella sp.]
TADGVLAVDLSDQSGGQKGAILYSNNANQVQTTADFIELRFRYVMAQVVINLKYDQTTMANESISTVSSVVLEGTGLYTTCDFHVETGAVTTTLVNGEGTQARGRIYLQPSVETTQATVVPGTGMVQDLTITVATAGHTYVAKPTDVIAGFQAGCQYIYNVTLKGGGEVEIGETTILPWEPGNDATTLPPIVGEQEN